MTQKEIDKKFQQYAELGKALDILKTLSKEEIHTFCKDVQNILYIACKKDPVQLMDLENKQLPF